MPCGHPQNLLERLSKDAQAWVTQLQAGCGAGRPSAGQKRAALSQDVWAGLLPAGGYVLLPLGHGGGQPAQLAGDACPSPMLCPLPISSPLPSELRGLYFSLPC